MSRIRVHRSICMVVLASSVALSACHSTHMAATWRDPGASGPLAFRRPIAIFVTKSETMRRMMEDKLVAQMPNGQASYRVLGPGEVSDGAAVRQQLAAQGFDGAIIMRVVDVQDKLTYTPGTYWYGGGAPYYSFAGYWRTAWGYPYDPGYVTEDKIVSIETQIFSLVDDKLIWAGRSETTNPKSVSKLGDSVIRHVTKNLRKEGLMISH